MWWEFYQYQSPQGNRVKVTFLPAVHWSQRGLFDKNKSLWGSWLIEVDGHTIYFAGDTAYSDHFSAIKQWHSPIDTVLMPIGPCLPQGIMRYSHLDAAQAGQAFLDLGAQQFIPMHWGTFRQWWHDNQHQLTEKKLHILKVGQQLEHVLFQPSLHQSDSIELNQL